MDNEQTSARPSKFEEWMSQTLTEPPGRDALDQLATFLVCKNVNGNSGNNSYKNKISTGRVSWKGIHVKWFQRCFVNLSQVQALLDFECPMWFFRNHGIKAMLRSRGIQSGSFVEHIQNEFQQSNDVEDTGDLCLVSDKATAFVSYTGSYSMKHFVELMLMGNLLEGNYLWLDIFCVDQFAWTERTDDEMMVYKRNFMAVLYDKVGQIGFTGLLLVRYDNVMTAPLGQIWVIWELFATADNTAQLTLLFCEREYERYVNEGLQTIEGIEAVLKSLDDIDASKAQAYDPRDRELILQLMERRIGIHQVNTRVMDQMRRWLLRVGITNHPNSGMSVLADRMCSLYEAMGDLERAVTVLRLEVTQLEQSVNTLQDLMGPLDRGVAWLQDWVQWGFLRKIRIVFRAVLVGVVGKLNEAKARFTHAEQSYERSEVLYRQNVMHFLHGLRRRTRTDPTS